MNHNLVIFLIMYAGSCIPWIASFAIKDREAQWGLALADTALTWGSYIFFAKAYGWWLVLAIAINISLGLVMKGIGLYGYDNLTDREAKRAASRA